MTKRTIHILLLCGSVASCGGPQGCFPKITDLKSQYPVVIYKGPKLPSEVTLSKVRPSSWTPLDSISPMAQGAILVSEDWAFYQHPGYDAKQIQEAISQSLAAGKMKRGASTITQQVARNIYLTKEKSIVRKVREIWISTKLEKLLGKKKILELYFNIAEWGEGVFGIKQAAQVYFQKAPSQLTAKEGAFLAMLLPSPKKYAISFRQRELTPFARRIVHSVLGKMVRARFITAEESQREWNTPLSFEAKFDPKLTPEDTEEPLEEEVPADDEDEDLASNERASQ